MKVNFPENITGTCRKCLCKFAYPSSEFIKFEDSFERAMGYETELMFRMTKKCSDCGNKQIISMIAYDYPPGAVNLVMPNIHGVALNHNCEDFFEDDFEDSDEDKADSRN